MNTTYLPTSGDFDLVRMGVYPNPEYKTELLQSGQLACTFHGSSGDGNATGGTNLADGNWHHIECLKTASQIQLLIDGNVAATTNAAVGSVNSTEDTTLGSHDGSYDWYHGLLDEVSITYN
jgi:hypothetical protein